MAQSPEELKAEIEQTRQDMSRDVDRISDKVSPHRIVQRRVDRTKGAVGSVRERVMGTASSGTSMIGEKASMVGDKASSAQSTVTDTVSGAPQAAIDRTQGNPLIAGMLAFASGWLVASLLPASEKEQQAAQAIEDKLKDPVKEQLSGLAQEMKGGLQDSAQDAVQSVKETATEAAQTVADQGRQSAETVRSEAQGATEEVRGSASDGGDTDDSTSTNATSGYDTSGSYPSSTGTF